MVAPDSFFCEFGTAAEGVLEFALSSIGAGLRSLSRRDVLPLLGLEGFAEPGFHMAD